jgi:hypothetical protein
MHESLVNREGDRPPEKRKGREETRNWSKETRMGSEPPTK